MVSTLFQPGSTECLSKQGNPHILHNSANHSWTVIQFYLLALPLHDTLWYSNTKLLKYNNFLMKFRHKFLQQFFKCIVKQWNLKNKNCFIARTYFTWAPSLVKSNFHLICGPNQTFYIKSRIADLSLSSWSYLNMPYSLLVGNVGLNHGSKLSRERNCAWPLTYAHKAQRQMLDVCGEETR